MRKVIAFWLLIFVFLFKSEAVFAYSFGLIAPSEQLTRGQEVTFTITIDSKGESLTTARVGLEYDTAYLKFTNAVPGDTFTSISVEENKTGQLILTGSTDSPFSGKGTFAYVKFKLIATAPGSTQLCTLFNPEEVSPTPTAVPTPTQLPKSGNTRKAKALFYAGSFLFLTAAGITLYNKRTSKLS